MTTYLFNEGSFDSLDVGVVDATVHILSFDDDCRLFVERTPGRVGATAEAVAEDRTRLESRERSRYVVLAKRSWGSAGADACEVAAYFLEGALVRYHLRRHFLHGSSAFMFSMMGPIAARDRVDARLNRALDTLRLRES